MARKIVISSLLNKVQVGIVENGRLAEYYLEQSGEERFEGNLYKGRVVNILPGMESAFVDIGVGRNAFLFLPGLPKQVREKLKVGSCLLVQVAKEADNLKGPRVTTDIGLPGRYLVLMPHQAQSGISRRITEEKERARLKEIAEAIRPDQMGVIVRTVAQGCSRAVLKKDLKALLREWSRIERDYKKKAPLSLIYRDYDLIHRILRDEFVPGRTKIIVDNARLIEQLEDELRALGVRTPFPVRYYEGERSLFEHLGLNRDLQKAGGQRVWLDCGGYLVFDQTEALLSIDVNTGKYVGKKDLQETVFKTNLQAAQEIARQLRLRNIGGIVIIDFIDMNQERNRQAVLEQLALSLEADKIRTRLLGFTRLGLVELTRKKSRKPLDQLLQTDCPFCGGAGKVIADEATALQIAAEVRSLAGRKEIEAVLVRCHSAVAAQIIGVEGRNLKTLEEMTSKTIFVKGDDSVKRDFYELSSGDKGVLKKEAYPVRVGERLLVTITDSHARNGDNGVARVDGLIVECLDCNSLIGQTVEVEIVEMQRTSALARLVDLGS